MNGAIETSAAVPSMGRIPLTHEDSRPFRRLVPARATAHPARASGSSR